MEHPNPQPDCECLRCSNCDGEGRYEALVPRIGYRMGPDLVEAWVTCPQCEGLGRLVEDCPVHDLSGPDPDDLPDYAYDCDDFRDQPR